MTQEEKNLLLLKDICARLPYGVICKSKSYRNILFNSSHIPLIESEEIKPYLRSMSSMTEEEKECCDYLILHMEDWLSCYDYLNSRYLDYRGLIPMGLALEAPENMYNIKEK